MAARKRTIDRTRIRTEPAKGRVSKVRTRDEAVVLGAGATVSELLDSLPGLLGARDLNRAIDAWSQAWRRDRTVLLGFGAHLIKVGLAPIVVDLLERGALSGIMMNGAGCVHDLELATIALLSRSAVSRAIPNRPSSSALATSSLVSINAVFSRPS